MSQHWHCFCSLICAWNRHWIRLLASICLGRKEFSHYKCSYQFHICLFGIRFSKSTVTTAQKYTLCAKPPIKAQFGFFCSHWVWTPHVWKSFSPNRDKSQIMKASNHYTWGHILKCNRFSCKLPPERKHLHTHTHNINITGCGVISDHLQGTERRSNEEAHASCETFCLKVVQ